MSGTRRMLRLTVALAVMVMLALTSLLIGPYKGVTPADLARFLVSPETLSPLKRAVITARFHRMLAGVIVGSTLALAGASLQYVFRNPLADPYVFGIASGAALGVVAALYAGLRAPSALYAAAMLGSLGALVIVLLGGALGGGSPFSYIVVGVSVGYLLWALSLILLLLMGPEAHYSLLWLFGTLAYTTPGQLRVSGSIAVVACAVSLVLSRRYSKLILGPEVASIHGVPYRKASLELVALSGLATAAATSLAGPVGFVGIVAPWVARVSVGSLYGRFVAASILWGSSVVLAGDIFARVAGGPVEVPLTAVLSLMGVPMIFYILLKSRGIRVW